jgi:hypothetical protein
MGPDMMYDHHIMHSHEMMGGHGMYSMPYWMPVGLLLCMVLLVGITWLVMLWLNNQNRMAMTLYSPQPQDSYQSYELGYRPRPPLPETYQEGDREYHYPQPRHGQSLIELEYPQPEMPWQQ